jgi:hypothetical protein
MTNNPIAHPEIVARISSAVEGLTPEQVNAVLEAWNHVREGDPVGTIRRDKETGAVAHRVDAEGLHLWRVSTPDGDQYNNLEPTLDWPIIFEIAT